MGAVADMVTSLFGGETRAEKAAKEAQSQQQAALQAAQADAAKQLQERQDRMKRAQKGRGSLLSGSELGVTQDQTQLPLQKKLG